MKEKKMTKRILSLALVACMILAFALPTNAARASAVRFTKVENGDVSNLLDGRETMEKKDETPEYADTDIVRVIHCAEG